MRVGSVLALQGVNKSNSESKRNTAFGMELSESAKFLVKNTFGISTKELKLLEALKDKHPGYQITHMGDYLEVKHQTTGKGFTELDTSQRRMDRILKKLQSESYLNKRIKKQEKIDQKNSALNAEISELENKILG